MALPIIPLSNVGIYAHIREATDCTDTAASVGGFSLGGLIAGAGGGSITHTFGAQGGPCDTMPDAIPATANPPHAISEVLGFGHDNGGGEPPP
jgi:hypothetical protein